MGEMIIALCGASVLCAFITALSPDGALGRFVGLACSLVLLAVVFLSLADVQIPTLNAGDAGEREYASSSDWLVEQSARQIGKSVAEYVALTYGYGDAVVSVTLDTAEIDSIRLVGVCVDLRHLNAVRYVYEIEAQLEKSLGCDVEVLVR